MLNTPIGGACVKDGRRALWWGRACLPVIAILASACGANAAAQSERQGWVSPTPAPALLGVGLNGERLDVSAYRGHLVVIDFWASWCGPCRAEQPDLNTMAKTYTGRGVHFIGDDMRDSLSAARSYVSELDVRYPSIIDTSSDSAAAFGVDAPPTVIVVDQGGRIVGRYLGTLTGVTQQLDALLAAT